MYKRKLADNAGNAAVENLHFDYSLTGKNKFLTTPTGAVIGQFQHYGVNFLIYNVKLLLMQKMLYLLDNGIAQLVGECID